MNKNIESTTRSKMSQATSRRWYGRWIAPDLLIHNEKEAPAPRLRGEFNLDSLPEKAELYLAGVGWHELYINGQRPDDRVLAPAPSQFDKHVHYLVYDVQTLLQKGTNVIEVILGNGWYDCGTATKWRTEHTPWRDTVKLCCDLLVDDRVVFYSNNSWSWTTTPIVFNELRNGETYDARLEEKVTEWKKVAIVPSPGGIPVLETAPPCRITRYFEPCGVNKLDAFDTVYDFSINMSGVCSIDVSGPAGAEIWIDYGETLRKNGDIDNADFIMFINSGNFQRDKFILKGEGVEHFQPRFTYHGFRYAKVRVFSPEVVVHQIRAAFIHTDFAVAGSVECSDATLSALQKMTLQSYRSNFVGIPTDCPHREKNGWTGDAMLAMDCGLWNFDCANACRDFLQTVIDTQRPSGQLAAVAPTGIFGYNYWSGPAWDSVIFEYAYKLYLFTGDTETLQLHYDALVRYLDYCRSMENDEGLLDFGLGDWCHPDHFKITPVELTSTVFYYYDLTLMARFARIIGRDPQEFEARAAEIRKAILKKYPADKFDSSSELTARAAMLFFNITPEAERAGQAAALVEAVRERKHRAEFGILGAKWVPRVLAGYGYIDDAYKLFTQEDMPGWGYWVKAGETTLCEAWNLRHSHNHIMFGDVSAWMYEYLGGVRPIAEKNGFEEFVYEPQVPEMMSDFAMSHSTQYGEISSRWRRLDDNRIEFVLTVPQGCRAQVRLGSYSGEYSAGEHVFYEKYAANSSK